MNVNDIKELTFEDKKILGDPILFYDYHNVDFEISNKNLFKNRYGEIADLKFHIRYNPLFDKYKKPDEPSQNEEETFTLKLYKSNNANGTALILVHGLLSNNKKIYIQLAERFLKRGISSVVYTLPFHFERSPKNIDKQKLLNLMDFMDILEFHRRSVIELRFLINYLKTTSFKKVGCMGFSLGGYCCDILSCVEENMNFAIPMASPGNLSPIMKIIKKNDSLSLNSNNTLSYGSSNESEPESYWSDSRNNRPTQFNLYLMKNYHYLINPIFLKPKLKKQNILLIQGLFDTRAPALQAAKFRKAWNYPPIRWLPCGHFTFFLFNRLNVKFVTNFIRTRISKTL